jgi:hypothetical protein
MKSLIWKEWREHFKWAVLPSLLILGPMPLFGVPMLMSPAYLAYVSLVAGLSAALLGFLQAPASESLSNFSGKDRRGRESVFVGPAGPVRLRRGPGRHARTRRRSV